MSIHTILSDDGTVKVSSSLPQIKTRLIDCKEVEALTGFSRSHIYAKLDANSKYVDPRMPRQVVTGKRQVKWVESEVIAYINQLIEEGRK